MNSPLSRFGAILFALAVVGSTETSARAEDFRSNWPDNLNRVWIGPQYWANRLQDWQLRQGRVECVEASKEKPTRALQLLTASISAKRGAFEIGVRTGQIEPSKRRDPAGAETWTGFLIGAGGPHVDYRLTALTHHRPAEDGGLIAAVNGYGDVLFRDFSQGPARNGGVTREPQTYMARTVNPNELGDIRLKLVCEPTGDTYQLHLLAHNGQDGTMLSKATLDDVAPGKLDGGIALVSHHGPSNSKRGYWFRDWTATGSKITCHPERANGPILGAMHTLSRGVLKMTAQMPPLGLGDSKSASLQIRHDNNRDWRTAARATLDADSHTFRFRVENWNANRDADYRILYTLRDAGDESPPSAWQGTIRAEPKNREEFVLAAFTGHRVSTGAVKWNHNGLWFPHNELVAAVAFHKPDLLFFSGDQIYEGDLTGAQRTPLDKSMLDYLDKWYRWCWAFRDLTRDIPSVAIPDDHDVYHGNIWGAGGRHAPKQDDGGYRMPAPFVKMVERTQTSHLPDPFDPTPVEQGIGVYYTNLDYAGISFAILEDRKWKSSPTPTVPEGKVVNGWFQNRDFDPATQADVPGAELLGERQLKFLRVWSADWANGIWMKTVLSQTIFANVATLPAQATSDKVVPKLDRLPPGVYAENDAPVADADSNGWPQTGRNKALREMRRGFAFHVAGDQHLGSFVHYGTDEPDDAGFAFCVPSVANVFPRRWYPRMPGKNRQPDAPRYTGQFRDGFGNNVTVWAVSNPVVSGKEPAALYDRAPGYGIVRFDRKTREITAECWPRWIDPTEVNAKQYVGWPITIDQQENYGRQPVAYLPTLEVTGMTDPVVQVVDEANAETLYTIRINGTRFRPMVYKEGQYGITVGEPGTKQMKTFEHVPALPDNEQRLRISF